MTTPPALHPLVKEDIEHHLSKTLSQKDFMSLVIACAKIFEGVLPQIAQSSIPPHITAPSTLDPTLECFRVS